MEKEISRQNTRCRETTDSNPRNKVAIKQQQISMKLYKEI